MNKVSQSWGKTLPPSWQVVKISDVFTVGRGVSDTRILARLENAEGPCPVYSLDSVRSGRYEPEMWICREDTKAQKAAMLKPGDFLVRTQGNVGEYWIVPEGVTPGLCSNRYIMILRPSEAIDSTFFRFLLDRELGGLLYEQLNENADSVYVGKTAHLRRADGHSVRMLRFPLPSITEQREIAAALLDVERHTGDLIEMIGASVKLQQSLRKKEITRALTVGIRKTEDPKDGGEDPVGPVGNEWRIERLLDVCAGIDLAVPRSGYKTMSKMQDSGEKKDLLNYRIKDVFANYFGGAVEYLDERMYADPKKNVLTAGDLLTSRRVRGNEYYGRAEVIPEGIRKGVFDSDLFRIRANEDVLPVWAIAYLFNETDIIRNQIETSSNYLSVAQMRGVRIPVIPKEYQQEVREYIEDRISVFDNLISEKNALIENLRRYRKRISIEYVTGKKRVMR